MGQLFKKFWQDFNVKVFTENDWANASTLLKNADLVVVSVPIRMGDFTTKSQASTDKFLTNIPSIYKPIKGN